MLAKAVGGQAQGNRRPKPFVGLPSADQVRQEQAVILDYLSRNPSYKSLWAFRLADGTEKFTVTRLYSAGNEGVDNPGAVDPDGWLYTTYGSWYGGWSNYPYCLARIHYKDGRAEILNPVHDAAAGGRHWGNTFEWDEGYNVSVAGRRVYVAHQDLLWGLDMDGYAAFAIAGQRDLYGGVYGFQRPLSLQGRQLTVAANEWHGSGRGAVAVCGKELFWNSGGLVICMEGK